MDFSRQAVNLTEGITLKLIKPNVLSIIYIHIFFQLLIFYGVSDMPYNKYNNYKNKIPEIC
jgi:hypothetical protein